MNEKRLPPRLMVLLVVLKDEKVYKIPDKYTVTVGPRAYSFQDQSTGITVCRREDKELSRRQFRAPKIQKAIASGHLIIIADKSEIEKYSISLYQSYI